MEKISTTIIINKNLLQQVKKLAAADHRSVNSLINKLLEDYVKAQGGE